MKTIGFVREADCEAPSDRYSQGSPRVRIHQVGYRRPYPFEIAHTPAEIDLEIGPDLPTARLKAVPKCPRPKLSFPVVLRVLHQHGDAAYRYLQPTDGSPSECSTVSAAARDLCEKVLGSVCAPFTTGLLWPGLDGRHEDHIQLDLTERAITKSAGGTYWIPR